MTSFPLIFCNPQSAPNRRHNSTDITYLPQHHFSHYLPTNTATMGLSSLPKTMKAIQVVEYKKPYKFQDVDVPTNLQPNDILVKVAVASNCHTDSMVQSGVFSTKLPCTGSHEGAGTIAAVGSSVSNFKEGDRVMCGIPLRPCGSCQDCLGPENMTQYCGNTGGMIGVTTDGCFAEYVVADARCSTKLPDEVSFLSAAPLACAGRTVWRGCCRRG